MKQIILAVVLLAAAGGTLYFLFQKESPQPTSFQQELMGEWQIDSVALSKKDSTKTLALLILALDSNFTKYSYELKEDVSIVKKLGDSILKEKISYRLKDSTAFIIKDEAGNLSYELKFIDRTTSDFILMDTDSTRYYFKRKQF